MKQKQNLARLKRVKKVDAPPFLFTRINAKIAARQADVAPLSWKWASALAFGLMLLLNILAAQMNQRAAFGSQDSIEALANGLQMTSSNQLYHE